MRNIEIDKARLFLYNLLSMLFVEEYTKNSVEKIVENLEILSNNAFDEDVSKASKEILEYLKNNGTDTIIKVRRYDSYLYNQLNFANNE